MRSLYYPLLAVNSTPSKGRSEVRPLKAEQLMRRLTATLAMSALPAPPRALISDFGSRLSAQVASCFEEMLAATLAHDEQREMSFR